MLRTAHVIAQCYYKRVHTICTSDDLLTGYQGLFAKGYDDMDDLQAQLATTFGESFATEDPTLLALMQTARRAVVEGPDLSPREDICSTDAFATALSLDEIVVSCMFALIESWCGADGGDFAYEMKHTTFKLPVVRFDYDVSPPPPPPAFLSAFQKLVDQDPVGFRTMSGDLDMLFPRLSHVAQSSIGSTIANSREGGVDYLGEEEVLPHQLTRAYLASRGMEPDSLGARVIEAKHTGRWRYACVEMHRLFDRSTSPGRRSAAYRTRRTIPDIGHNSEYDRNPLLMAMLIIKLSMDGHALGITPFSSLEMYQRICGGGASAYIEEVGDGPAGWRVAVPQRYEHLYTAHRAYDDAAVENFVPIVATGSLERLRSMKGRGDTSFCDSADVDQDEDAARGLYCAHNELAMQRDLTYRVRRTPFELQRSVWCDPNKGVGLAATVGNIFTFDPSENLLDTSLKLRASLHDLEVLYWQRDEEKVTDAYRERSLRGWVLVTSSADPRYPPGMHRLIDLAVFTKKLCSELPDVMCTSSAQPVQIRLNTRGEVSDNSAMGCDVDDAGIVTNEPLSPGEPPCFLSGREALMRIRYSSIVQELYEAHPQDNFLPYKDVPGCHHGVLPLNVEPDSEQYMARLAHRPPPPPTKPPIPPSSPSPPPPTPPPPSSPPPLTQRVAMRRVRVAERRACTTVHFLDVATRCERLLLDLAIDRIVVQAYLEPPPPPPSAPVRSPPRPPPSPPPSPPTVRTRAPHSTRLSTYRWPDENGDDVLVGASSRYYTADQADLRVTLRTTPIDRRACVYDAPLACCSGVVPKRCLNGARRCSVTDDGGFANSVDPFLEAQFHLTAGYYVWALRLTLPSDKTLAHLAVGPKRAVLFGTNDAPVECAEANAVVTEGTLADGNRELLMLCAPANPSNALLYALSTIHRVRLTLVGSYRQLWLADDGIQIVERALGGPGGAGVPLPIARPPPPPPPPPQPATPPMLPPDPSCPFETGHVIVDTPPMVRRHEPCGLDHEACCAHAREAWMDRARDNNNNNTTDAMPVWFEIDDAGCCDLFVQLSGLHVNSSYPSTFTRSADGEGIGALTKLAGAGWYSGAETSA